MSLKYERELCWNCNLQRLHVWQTRAPGCRSLQTLACSVFSIRPDSYTFTCRQRQKIHLLLSLRYLALGAAGMSQRVSNKWQRTICIKDPWSMSLIGNNRPKAEHHQRFSSDAQQEALSHDTRVLRKRSLLTPWKTCQSITSPIHSKYSKYIFWKEQRINRTKSCTKPTPTKGVTLGRIF